MEVEVLLPVILANLDQTVMLLGRAFNNISYTRRFNPLKQITGDPRIAKQLLKINEPRYIALFMVSGSIKKLVSIDCVNIYLSQSILIIFSQHFCNRFKSVGLAHTAYILIH